MPIRIQRKRTKGFSLQAQSPDGLPVVSVCRPGRWGNPFIIGHYASIIRLYGYTFYEVSSKASLHAILPIKNAADAVRLHRDWLPDSMQGMYIDDLRGKHLACFCALDQPCHADILLELANA